LHPLETNSVKPTMTCLLRHDAPCGYFTDDQAEYEDWSTPIDPDGQRRAATVDISQSVAEQTASTTAHIWNPRGG
jgi:hypothetical protein